MTGEDTWDVIVVGSGFAGLTAAIEARNGGASVLVLEKMKAPGGNSLISDGGIAAAGTAEQSAAGIIDSADLMFRDMMKAGLGINHPELLRTLTEQSREAFEWSRDYLSVNYLDRVDIFGGHSVPRCFTPEGISGGAIIKKLMARIRDLSIPISFQTRFREFIFDGNRKITGLKVEDSYDFKTGIGRNLRSLRVKKAVILATGGFAGDTAFRSIQDPRLDATIQSTNQPFVNSETLRTALKAGAAPVHLSRIQLGPWASPDESGYGDGPLFSEYILFLYGLIVDPATGKRFVNEMGDRKSLSDSILETGHPCIGIADDGAVKKSGWNIDRALRKKVVRSYDSLEPLAQAYGMDEGVLRESVERFNASIEMREDREFSKPIPDRAEPLRTAPYYAIRLWPKVHYTMGGLNIDREARVLDLEGVVIPGLYAAGELCGGVHGASRLGSCGITECLVFGRIAGKNGAQEY